MVLSWHEHDFLMRIHLVSKRENDRCGLDDGALRQRVFTRTSQARGILSRAIAGPDGRITNVGCDGGRLRSKPLQPPNPEVPHLGRSLPLSIEAIFEGRQEGRGTGPRSTAPCRARVSLARPRAFLHSQLFGDRRMVAQRGFAANLLSGAGNLGVSFGSAGGLAAGVF
jgi:hypothetical protein